MELLPSLVESERAVISQIHHSESLLSQKIDRSQTATLRQVEQKIETLSNHFTSRIDDVLSGSGRVTRAHRRSPRQPLRLAKDRISSPTPYHNNNNPHHTIDSFFLASAHPEPTLATFRWNRPSLRRCKSTCPCRCHSRPAGAKHGVKLISRWEVNCFEKVLGSASLDYFGFLTRKKSCNHRNCQNHQAGEVVKFRYQFPPWLVNMAVNLYFSTRLTGSPELLIRVCNTLSPDGCTLSTTIFGFVDRGDVEGVKSVLRQRSGSIHDIRADDRRTALCYSIDMENLGLIRLLLQSGADPLHEDGKLQTPIQLALERIETGCPWGNQLAEVFPVNDLMQEETTYTPLHRIILGLLPSDLETELQNPTIKSLIELPSWTGRTPLQLAVIRCDIHATTLLLQAGANVSTLTDNALAGWLAIHQASAIGIPEIVQLLLDHGADLHAPTTSGDVPLHLASRCSGATSTLSLLLRHGANIHCTNNTLRTPLFDAVENDRTDAIYFLLDHGADINHRDCEGNVVLFLSAQFDKSHTSARYLLGLGANYTVVNCHGRNVLHFLALGGDLETMEVFGGVKMVGVDVDAVDDFGRTPREVFEGRAGMGEGWEFLALRGAFDELLASCSVGREVEVTPDSEVVSFDELDLDGGLESDEGEFLDAMQEL